MKFREYSKYELELIRSADYSDLIRTRIRVSPKYRVTNCPFHDDRKASFVIKNSNYFECYSTKCCTRGNAIDFVMKIYGYNFQEACAYIVDRYLKFLMP